MKILTLALKSIAIIFLIQLQYHIPNHEIYEIARWSILGAFLYFAWFSNESKHKSIAIFFIFGMLIFNPFSPPKFHRDTWLIVDRIFALGILFSIPFDYFRKGWLSVFLKNMLLEFSKTNRQSVFRELKTVSILCLSVCSILFCLSVWNAAISMLYVNLERKKDKLKEDISLLPTDYTHRIYNIMKPKFSELFKVGSDTMVVLSIDKSFFSQRYPDAIKLNYTFSSPVVFSENGVFRNRSLGKVITDSSILAELNEMYPYQYSHMDYSYGYLTYSEFETALKNNKYLEGVVNEFRFYRMKDSLMLGLGYSSEIEERKQDIINNSLQVDSSMKVIQSRYISSDLQEKIINWASIIVAFTYSCRALYYLSKWLIANIFFGFLIK